MSAPAPLPTEGEELDMSIDADVIKIGEVIGKAWVHQVLIPLLRHVPPENCGLLFSSVIAAQVGCATAAIGHDGALAVLKRVSDGVELSRGMAAKEKH